MMIEWTHEDQEKALRQGWGIFHCTAPAYVEIQKFDNPEDEEPENRFETDEEAVAYVKGRAACSDEHAMRALQYCKEQTALLDEKKLLDEKYDTVYEVKMSFCVTLAGVGPHEPRSVLQNVERLIDSGGGICEFDAEITIIERVET